MSIMRFVWFRKGLKAFNAEVSAALESGWQLDHFEAECGWLGLRWLCVAVLKRE